MMGFITKFIPMPWLIGVIAVAFAAMAGWTWIAQARMEAAQANAHAEKTRADANTGAYLTLAKLTATQNTEILDLKASADAREEAAKAAALQAQQAAKPHEARSTYYLGLKPPQGGQCESAWGLAHEYIKTRAVAAAGSVRN